jgi:hypothetical protein
MYDNDEAAFIIPLYFSFRAFTSKLPPMGNVEKIPT